MSLTFPTLSLPQIDMKAVETEWRRLISSIPEPWKLNNDGREFQVGEAMASRGLSAHYPVVMVPGVISTVGLHFHVFTMLEAISRDWSLGQHRQPIGLSFDKKSGVDLACYLKSLSIVKNGLLPSCSTQSQALTLPELK